MILRPHSLESFQPYRIPAHSYFINSEDMRKKVENFSFHPKDKIGKGYSSVVYKGQNDLTGQTVAIKVIELKSLTDQNTKNFLQNELECIRKLNHQNTLKYINSFMTANNCYIVTEHYSKGDLAKELKTVRKFDEQEAFEIFSQIYSGYCHFHQKGYIHRDIKPSNVLVSDQQVYALADFGFIKKVDGNPQETFSVGTPAYMPPQSLTANIYTEKSDIWSLGVLLFEILFGSLPFNSRTSTQLKKDVCSKELRLQEIEAKKKVKLSSDVKNLIFHCLRKNPENRIELYQIGQHPWFKRNKPTPENNLDVTSPYIPFSQQSEQKVEQQSQQFSYVGNQPIKRQHSIQGHGRAFNNYFKMDRSSVSKSKKRTIVNRNKSIEADKQNICENSLKIRQRFKELDSLVQKSSERVSHLYALKDFTLKPLEDVSIKNQSLQRPFLNTKDYQSRLNNPLKKVQINRKFNGNNCAASSLKIRTKASLTGNTENNTSTRNSSINSIGKPKGQQSVERLTSTPFDKLNDSQGLLSSIKSMATLKNAQLSLFSSKEPKPTDFQQTSNRANDRQSVERLSGSLQMFKSDQLISYQSLPSINERYNASYEKEDLMEMIRLKTAQQSSPGRKISNNEFCIRSIHLLRFLFECLKNAPIHQEHGREQVFNLQTSVYQTTLEYFSKFFVKIVAMSEEGYNSFNLPKWTEFKSEEKYSTFQTVIKQYYAKFTSVPFIHSAIKEQPTSSRFVGKILTQIQTSQIELLYQRCINQSEVFCQQKSSSKGSVLTPYGNSEIEKLFYNCKCLQNLRALAKLGEKQFLETTNTKQQMTQLQKQNDPFKISKMLLEFKKKKLQLSDPIR